jgi:septum formation protein
MKSLILASTSPYRKMLLEKIVEQFSQVAPDVDEDMYKNQNIEPLELSRLLSVKKAEAVFAKNPNQYVLGGDQVAVNLKGKIFGKPGSKEKAFATLRELSGEAHFLHTSYAIIGPNNYQDLVTVSTKLTMRNLSDKEIENYILKDNPIDTAGSYKIEGLGISLFDKIESEDFTSITGLPLMKLAQSLRIIGFQIP